MGMMELPASTVPALRGNGRGFFLFNQKEGLVSHLVSIKTQVRDAVAVQAACRRLNIPEPSRGTAQLYSGQATGLLLMLPEWRYPVVIDPEQGDVQFDNFEGAWGDSRHLDKFLQMYAVEKAKLEARRAGHSVTEEALHDGSIRLRIGQEAS